MENKSRHMIKLNSDLGESFGAWKMGLDEEVMPCIDQANIACGFHAGDPMVMLNTLQLAKQHGVSVGAHPSYPDQQGFGRRSMNCTMAEITAMLTYQIAAIEGMAKTVGLQIDYVKPHGALYNDMMKSHELRQTIMLTIADYSSDLKLMLQATGEQSNHMQEAQKAGISLIFEAFADRAYTDEGLLASRTLPGAVLSKEQTLDQVKQLVSTGEITTQNGKQLKLAVDSICVHGDNMTAVNAIKDIQQVVKGA